MMALMEKMELMELMKMMERMEKMKQIMLIGNFILFKKLQVQINCLK